MNKNFALQAQNVSFNIGKQSILSPCSFHVPAASMAALVGPNGVGKSTLFRALCGLLPQHNGEVFLFDKASQNYRLREKRKLIAYMAQEVFIDWNFPITVAEVVEMGLFAHTSLFRRLKKNDKEWANHCLESVELVHLRNRPIMGLSGGEKRRMFFARMLAQKARLLLLDEPLAGVDEKSEAILLQLLQRLQHEGKTIFMIHHDLATVRQYFNWLVMFEGQTLRCGATEALFKKMKNDF